MEDLDAFVVELLNGLAALPEGKMRVDFLGRRLGAVSPDDAAMCLDVIYGGEPSARLRVCRATLADHDGFKEALGPDAYRRISEAARRLELRKVVRLFSEIRPARTGLAGYAEEEEAPMEFISLGRRRSLARGRIKDTLDRLLSDPDPVVIANILNNPRITEKEVLKIASKRPSTQTILRLIAGHRVWSKRYDVIKAVVLNPYSPPKVSIALLGSLMTQDLKALSIDSSVHPVVRIAAGEMLSQRGFGQKT